MYLIYKVNIFFTLKMVVEHSSETLVPNFQIT
jgi:hypothetical protein